MPTEQRIKGALDQIGENLEAVGDEVIDIHGPRDVEDEEEAESEDERIFYMLGESEDSRFWIGASTELQHMSVHYPFNIHRHLGQRFIDRDDLSLSLIEGDATNGESIDFELIGREIVENTPGNIVSHARFNVSAYGSSNLVGISFGDDFEEYHSMKAMYPYTEPITIKSVSDAVDPVVTMGKRSRRYIDSSFFLERDEDDEVRFNIRF